MLAISQTVYGAGFREKSIYPVTGHEAHFTGNDAVIGEVTVCEEAQTGRVGSGLRGHLCGSPLEAAETLVLGSC